jgi:hypothetical protein
MRWGWAGALALTVAMLPTTATGQTFKVGDRVDCNGNVGAIIGTQPRPGWDEPFLIVRTGSGASTYDLKCLPRQLRRTASLPPARDPARPDTASAPVTPPARRAPGPSVAASAGATAPDGVYDCHKITPGSLQLMAIGTLTIRGGRATLPGLPAGWTVRSISSRGRDARGKQLVAYDYRSASGWNDRLDCVAR